jgi:hypothetical protein
MSLVIRSVLLTALIAFSGIAQASNGYTPRPAPAAEDGKPAALSRAQVKADLAKAFQDGSLAAMNKNSGYPPEPVSTAAKLRTRAEVLEELRQAQADGSFRRMNTNRGY